MKTVSKTLLAATLIGAGSLGSTALLANPSQPGAKDKEHSAETMSHESMMGGESSGMMGMMKEMNRMMKSCNEMMESHRDHDEGTAKPAESAS